jgi:hypothetical protein
MVNKNLSKIKPTSKCHQPQLISLKRQPVFHHFVTQSQPPLPVVGIDLSPDVSHVFRAVTTAQCPCFLDHKRNQPDRQPYQDCLQPSTSQAGSMTSLNSRKKIAIHDVISSTAHCTGEQVHNGLPHLSSKVNYR